MIAREWKARVPENTIDGFLEYLSKTAVNEASGIQGFRGAQLFTRSFDKRVEVTLISFWDSIEAIQAFAGNNIHQAKHYPDDSRFNIAADSFVSHYDVVESVFL